MLKTAGILLVILGASGFGCTMALGVRRQAALLRQLLSALEQMKGEIAYQKTPLPELMRLLSLSCSGALAAFFGQAAGDLHLRQEGSVYAIFKKALSAAPPSAFPPQVRLVLLNLGKGLGKYDLERQLQSIDLAAERLQSLLDALQADQRARIRSYCTLGVCAGAAIAILAL